MSTSECAGGCPDLEVWDGVNVFAGCITAMLVNSCVSADAATQHAVMHFCTLQWLWQKHAEPRGISASI